MLRVAVWFRCGLALTARASARRLALYPMVISETEKARVLHPREKLRGAADTLRDTEAKRTMQERLRDVYVYNLSNLEATWFPDLDAQNEFASIDTALNRYGEMIEGAGSMPTTVFTMSDADARNLADRVFRLADRYLA